MGNHMPYGITQCYLTSGNSDFPASTPTEDGTRFSNLERCKAELTWVVVTSQDSLPAKDGHLSQNNQLVSWLGIKHQPKVTNLMS